MKNKKITNIEIYNKLSTYISFFPNNDCFGKKQKEFIISIFNEINKCLHLVREDYYIVEQESRKLEQTVISKRQKACFMNIIRSVEERMFSDAIREFMDYIENYNYKRMFKPVDINQYVMYTLIMEIITDKILRIL